MKTMGTKTEVNVGKLLTENEWKRRWAAGG